MAILKVIKSDLEHENAIARVMALMDLEPAHGSDDENELEVLSVLVEQYEHENFPIDKPEPIEAIRFRMDQQGLAKKDMVEYFGSASKVSEVLNGKRPLSINMIRRLNKGLGIPADILIQEPEIVKEIEEGIELDVDWQAFPLREMQKNGYFGDIAYSTAKLKSYAEDLMRGFLKSVPGCENVQPAMMRTSAHLLNNNKVADEYALKAWQVKVLKETCLQKAIPEYKKGVIDLSFMRRLAKTSWSDHGPDLACEYLYKHGIHLVFESHLDKTYLDGAVCINQKGNPVVALTLRYDRLDDFWFTLMHELAHIALHLDGNHEWFIDDLHMETDDIKEEEANDMAREALIPGEEWLINEDSSLEEMRLLADSQEISPSIVFGRFAREYDNWQKVRKQIPKTSSFIKCK